MSDKQIAAQQKMSEDSLAQSLYIAQYQAAANQQQFDYQQAQDTRRQTDAQEQADRQSVWDQSRNQRASAAAQQVDEAFSKFSPDYFKQYQQDYYGRADDEINRQYGYAQKDLTFGLARQGNLASTTGSDQFGKLLETKGRAEADQANAGVTAANALQSQVASAKTGLLGQALSTDTLGSPIAPGSSESVNAAIDQSNRAVSSIGAGSKDYAASINAVQPSLGALAGLFGGTAGGVGSYLSGVQDAKVAAAVGGSAPGATSLSGGGSRRIY